MKFKSNYNILNWISESSTKKINIYIYIQPAIVVEYNLGYLKSIKYPNKYMQNMHVCVLLAIYILFQGK